MENVIDMIFYLFNNIEKGCPDVVLKSKQTWKNEILCDWVIPALKDYVTQQDTMWCLQSDLNLNHLCRIIVV